MVWCMNRTNIYLPDALRERLDARAEAGGVSRAEIIRRLLEQGLTADEVDLDCDLAALEDSFGVLAEWDVPSGRQDDARMQHLDRVGR